MHLSKESATESCVIAFRITLLLRLPFIFEWMCQGANRAAVALLVEGTKDENYFSIISCCASTAARLDVHSDEDHKRLSLHCFILHCSSFLHLFLSLLGFFVAVVSPAVMLWNVLWNTLQLQLLKKWREHLLICCPNKIIYKLSRIYLQLASWCKHCRC